MNANIVCFGVTIALCAGVAVLVQLLVWRSLAGLLQDLLKLPGATSFYLRVLALAVSIAALSGALGQYGLKQDAAFMEYVWRVANGLSSALSNMSTVLAEYLLVVTVLVAVLRRRHE
jgi:hypothetical protein